MSDTSNKLNISDPFWINDPKILFTKFDIMPTRCMTNAERLNALTRLLAVITIVLYFTGYDQYFTVLALGILLILILRSNQPKEHFTPRRGVHDPCHTCGFDSNMAYINSKYETTPANQFSHVNYGLRSWTNAKYKVIPEYVPPPYSEVWRNEPRYCTEYSMNPNSYDISPTMNLGPSNRCHFEDREWVLNTPTGQCSQGKVSAMPAIQSAFMRDSLQFRNNIMGDYIDQIERTRQHNCVGFKPGRKTF
jgi:hypothetical protein